MYDLRVLEVQFYGGQQAEVQQRYSRMRRKAGLKAWATRIARYGPTGCRQRDPPRSQPQVIIMTTPPAQGDDLLGNDAEPRTQTRRPNVGHRPTGRSANPSTSPENHPGPDVLTAVQAEQTRDDEQQDIQPTPRTPLAEVDVSDLPVPPTLPALPSEGGTNVGEMIRLLNERRQRLLGPQDLSRPGRTERRAADRAPAAQPDAEPGTFTIFADEATGEDDGSELDDRSEEDKENAGPTWQGRDAPRAAGARVMAFPEEVPRLARARRNREIEPTVDGTTLEPFPRFFDD